MIGRSLRKLIALLFVVLGGTLVSGSVDITPVIGSPQIDYPAFDFRLPFWPQLVVDWLVVGGGGGLLAALGLLAWSDEPVQAPSLPRTAILGAALFAAIGGLRLAEFLAFGTMGPLHVQQPIFRFAVTQGLISAVVVTLEWIIASSVLAQPRREAFWLAPLTALISTGLAFLALILGIAGTTGLPLLRTFANWSPVIVILAPAAAMLVALARRNNAVAV